MKFKHKNLTVNIPQDLLPSDKVVLKLAYLSKNMAKNEIRKIIKNNRIISDYHPGINVIGFLLGVVHAWKSIKNRKVDYSEIDELENRIQETKKTHNQTSFYWYGSSRVRKSQGYWID